MARTCLLPAPLLPDSLEGDFAVGDVFRTGVFRDGNPEALPDFALPVDGLCECCFLDKRPLLAPVPAITKDFLLSSNYYGTGSCVGGDFRIMRGKYANQ